MPTYGQLGVDPSCQCITGGRSLGSQEKGGTYACVIKCTAARQIPTRHAACTMNIISLSLMLDAESTAKPEEASGFASIH